MTQPNPSKLSSAVQRLYREANQAWEHQEYQKSISFFEQATRKEPHNPALFLNLARAHGKRYDFPAAERSIEKAVQISKTAPKRSVTPARFAWNLITSTWRSAIFSGPARRRASLSVR